MTGTLGLETLDETVYRELLLSPALGVEELAGTLALEPEQVRRCLERLLALRLIQVSVEAPGRFTVVDPVLGLQQLLERQHDELIRRQRQVADGQAALVRMLAGTGPGAVRAEGVERLSGLDAVQRRLTRLAREAEHEVLTFLPGEPPSPAALAAAQHTDAALLRREVAVRTVGPDRIRTDGAGLEYARALAEQGGEVRTTAELPARMVLVDRAYALLPADGGAIGVSDPGMLAPLLALFEQTWAAATPLSAAGPEPLNAQERALITLIAQGHTDESAANQLHISARTARRMMASLIERLGARSRFEAGLRAARLGWV